MDNTKGLARVWDVDMLNFLQKKVGNTNKGLILVNEK